MPAPARPLTGPRALIEWALVAALSALLVGWMALTPVADGADHLVYDLLMQAKAGPSDTDIVIIGIDDRSLEALGRWPWPRDLHARLIDQLTQAGAGPVAYDVLFNEPAPEDAALAVALARNGRTYLPIVLDAPGLNGAPWREDAPSPALIEAAAGLGHVNLTVDADGAVRRLPLYLQAGRQAWPHLILPLAAQKGAVPPPPSPRADDQLFAADPEAVVYRGPPGEVRSLAFIDVLNGEAPAAFLKDKLVLVGATAPGLGDRYATPAAPHGDLRPGVEIQAALLQTVIEGGGPKDLPRPWALIASLLPLALLVAGFRFLRPAANMALGAGLIALTLAVSAAVFLIFDLWFAPTPAVSGLALAYPFWSWRRLAAASAYMQSEVEAFERDGVRLTGPARGDVVGRQVDALRAAVRQVRDLERFISDALRSLPDATVVADPHARIILSNDRAEALFGDRLKGDADLPLLFQSLGEPAWRRFLDLEADPGDITTANGLILKAAASVLTDAEGRPVGHIVRFADMTRFRAAERQRAEALQLLSHDMRAPQVSILTLLDGPTPRLDPMVERRVADYARQTLDLAEGYVQLARAESQPYRSELLDLGQVAMDAADILWPQASRKGVRILTPDGEEEFLVQGDPALLRRLATNLLDNALKYGPEGGTIEVALNGAEAADGHPVCVLTIRDHGPGLSPEAAERLFQPFGHGGADHRGAGLGLAFVRTVAERHGGTIRHEPGSPGATFILTLPRVVEEDE